MSRSVLILPLLRERGMTDLIRCALSESQRVEVKMETE